MNHDPVEYINSIFERQAYDKLLREYIGDDAFTKCTTVMPVEQSNHANEFVNRDVILDFIKANKKW